MESNQEFSGQEQGNFSLLEYWFILKNNKNKIIIHCVTAFIVVFAIGLAAYLLMPKENYL